MKSKEHEYKGGRSNSGSWKAPFDSFNWSNFKQDAQKFDAQNDSSIHKHKKYMERLDMLTATAIMLDAGENLFFRSPLRELRDLESVTI